MPRFTSFPSRVHLKRALQCLAILTMSACTDSCEDPTGADYQFALVGGVTLNGEPLPGVRVAANSATSQVTDESGRFNMRALSDSEPLNGCLSVTTSPYDAVTTGSELSCFALDGGEAFNFDFNYTHRLPVLEILTPMEGALIEAGTSANLRSSVSGEVTLNGLAAPAVVGGPTWVSSLDGELGPEYSGLNTVLSEGTHVLDALFTDVLGTTATDQVTVTVGAGNQAPVASIQSPSPNATYTTADAIQFSGSGVDPEEGTLTGASLSWSSAIEGTFGMGESFTRQLLAGTHLVRLLASDAQGAVNEATVVVTVTAAVGTGVIQGTLMYQGSPLANVTVTLTGATALSTTTDAQGAYAFMNLPSGGYTVTISPPPGTDIGMTQQVFLEPGQTLTVDFTG